MSRSPLILGVLAALLVAGGGRALAADPTPVAVPAAPPAATPDALSVLIDRYVAWRGGRAFKALTTIHARGALEEGGLTGTFEAWANDKRWRDEARLGGMDQIGVTTPDGSWATSISGQLISEPDAYESQRRLQVIEFGEALRGGDGAKTELVGAQSFDGGTWDVVRVSFGDADSYEALIDPQTGALDGFNIREKGQVSTERFSDWRWIDGVRMAFAEIDESDGAGKVTTQASEVDLNRPIDPALFGPLPEVRRASFAGGATSTGWIDFDLYAGGRVDFPVKVNGRPTIAMLDNGAFASVIDGAYAASIGLAPKGSFPTPGTGGVGATGRVGGVTLQIGDLTLSDLTVATLDLAGISRATGKPLAMLVGDDAFNELVVDIDFANHRIAFRDPKSFTVPPEAVKVPMVRVNDTRLVPLSLEGAAPAMFAVDIGNPGTIEISPAYARDRNLLAGRLAAEGRAIGVGGVFADFVSTLNDVEFAGVTFPSLPAAFPQRWPSATYNDRVQGAIGVGVLSRFRVILDWAHDGLYVIPNAQTTAPFAKDRLGMSWVAAGQGSAVVVTMVEPHSPAAAAGLKVGDRIDLINGRPATAAGSVGLGPAGDKVTLATRTDIKDATSTSSTTVVRTIVLADYY